MGTAGVVRVGLTVVVVVTAALVVVVAAAVVVEATVVEALLLVSPALTEPTRSMNKLRNSIEMLEREDIMLAA